MWFDPSDAARHNSAQAVKAVLAAESVVDLVVLGGDMISGYAWNGSDGWYASK
jgi:hypothetical protein